LKKKSLSYIFKCHSYDLQVFGGISAGSLCKMIFNSSLGKRDANGKSGQLTLCWYRVLCLLDNNLRGDVADPVSFKTPSCEPDAPSPPKLHARTINSILLKWNVRSDILFVVYYAFH